MKKLRSEKLVKVKDNITNVIDELRSKHRSFINRHSENYIIGYEKEDKNLKIISLSGECRYVKYSKANVNKVKKAIEESKVLMKDKIDNYDKNNEERMIVLLINSFVIIGTGTSFIFTFFMGYMFLFLISIIFFSFAVVTTTYIGINYYILVNKVKYIKEYTGYKNDVEINLFSKNVTNS